MGDQGPQEQCYIEKVAGRGAEKSGPSSTHEPAASVSKKGGGRPGAQQRALRVG